MPPERAAPPPGQASIRPIVTAFKCCDFTGHEGGCDHPRRLVLTNASRTRPFDRERRTVAARIIFRYPIPTVQIQRVLAYLNFDG